MPPRDLLSIPGFADPVSSLTHLLGALAALVMIVPTVLRARRLGRGPGAVASIIIFGLSAVFLLSMSGVYHLLTPAVGMGSRVGISGGGVGGGGARDVLQRLDHAAIFVLIAGTFTPIHTLLFRGVLRWGMLVFIWTLAVLGVTLKSIFFTGTPPVLGLGLYVVMGWFGIVAMVAVARRTGFRSTRTLVAGGVVYTIGALIEGLSPPPLVAGVVRAHEIFHLAVLGGLALHWRFVWNAIAMRPPPHPHPSPHPDHAPDHAARPALTPSGTGTRTA
jgi:channel protein (hemolysin III family)